MRLAGRTRLLVALLAGALAAACAMAASASASPHGMRGTGQIGTAVVATQAPGLAPVLPGPRPAPPLAPALPTPKPSPEPPRLFAPDSVWNAPLPPDAPLDPSSPQRMAAFRAEIFRQTYTRTGPWVEEHSNSTPIYTVGPDVKPVPVRIDRGGLSLAKPLAAVPIPPDAKPAHGLDAHLTIYQPSTDTMWEFYRLAKDARGWHAGWGGGMRNVSKSPGYYTSAAWEGLSDGVALNWGSTASGLPVAAGMATLAELRRGRIDHALAINIPWPCAGTFAWPAQNTDGTLTTPDCLPEGAHLRLDPALDISKLNLPPVTRMLAEAAQRYGMFVRDRTKHSTTFFLEDVTRTGQDPYRGPGGLYGGLTARQIATPFPWGSVQLLKATWCTRAPCRP